MQTLISENTLDNLFPQVKDFLNGQIPSVKLLRTDQMTYKRKTKIINNEIIIKKNFDSLYSLEFFGQCDDIFQKISNIELFFGQQSINRFYLSECYVSQNDNQFYISINFSNMFLNYPFLPICAIQFDNIKFKINGNIQNINIECYQVEGLLEKELRENCKKLKHEILFKHFEQYKLLPSNKFYLNFCTENIFNRGNFVKSLHFQFKNPIDFSTIKIYGNNQLLTTLTKNDVTFNSYNDFIVENFYYKIFLYNNIVIEFDKNINSSLCLTITNYNMLVIGTGMGLVRFSELRMDIGIGCEGVEYEDLRDDIYWEKVVPRDNRICAISHEEFKENEERVICGECYMSYRREVLEEWFRVRRERVCPYAKCFGGIWYKKNYII